MSATPFDDLMAKLAQSGILTAQPAFEDDPEILGYMDELDSLIYGEEPDETIQQDDNLEAILEALALQPEYKTRTLREFFEKKPDDIITGYSDGAMRHIANIRLTAEDGMLMKLFPFILDHLDLELIDDAELRGNLFPPINYYFMKNVFIDNCMAADIPLTDDITGLLHLICSIESRSGTPLLWDEKARELGFSGFTDKKILMLHTLLKEDSDITGISEEDIVINLNPKYSVKKQEKAAPYKQEPASPSEKTPLELMIESLENVRNINLSAPQEPELKNGVLTLGGSIIPDNAYRGRTDIREVILQEGVYKIGNSAFSFCPDLERVTAPSSLKRLGSEAFSNCKNLRSIDLPSDIEAIGNEAFYNCISLTDMPCVPINKEIGYDAFFACPFYNIIVDMIKSGIITPRDVDDYGKNNGTLADYAELSIPAFGGSPDSGYAYGFETAARMRAQASKALNTDDDLLESLARLLRDL